MTDTDFRALVKQLRAAQKWFFRSRAAEALEAARLLEGQVDRELREGAAPPSLLDGADPLRPEKKGE